MSESQRAASIVETRDGARLACHHLAGKMPTVVFLCGFRSDMSGTKALTLERVCAARGQAFLRLDYQGHGQSSGAFEDGTIGIWSDDAVSVIEAMTRGPLLLVGSSMGAWIMLLVARRLAGRVAGLVGVASAPDFTEDLMLAPMGGALRATLAREGRVLVPSRYDEVPTVVTAKLLEEGRRHLQLRAPIPIACPVRLLHGTADPDVPYKVSMRLLERLESKDVQLTLIKDGDHRLSSPENLALLADTVTGLLERIGE
jgi:pimeloyl-ACP methyl ester carboxylesterase